jgi:phosphatidylglycerol:prolipoprotein diacylglycerol transferase
LEGLVLLVVLYMLSRRKPPLPQGSYAGIFLIGYGVFRFAIEFIRQPDAQIGYLFQTEWVTMGMVLTLPMILASAGFFAYAVRLKRPQTGKKPALEVEAVEDKK